VEGKEGWKKRLPSSDLFTHQVDPVVEGSHRYDGKEMLADGQNKG
jgi:hypothetical protein